MRRQLLLSSGLHALALAPLLALPLSPLAEPDQPASIEVLFGAGLNAPSPPRPLASTTEGTDTALGEAGPATPAPAPALAPLAAPAEPEPGLRPERPDPTTIPARDRDGNRGPAYPRIAWRLHEQGTVVLRLYIAADGRVSRIETLTSSGVAALDEAAIAALSAWRFVPAERDGQPVASYRDQPVSFVLQ